MNYAIFFNETLSKLNFALEAVYNCYDIPYNPENPAAGWPLKLPVFNPKAPNDLLLLHFQDFFTNYNGRVVELDRVADHYGPHANRVLVTYWNHGLEYSGPVNTIEFSNHNYELVRSLNARWDDWGHITTQLKTKGWQCLNGRMCPHRWRTAEVLRDWANGILSYGNEIPLPEWAYSTYRGTENDENFVRLINVYGACAVNIVTETEYATTPGIISEKSLLAFAAQQVPIIIGHAGAVQHCRELGFDMFDDLVDTSYDTLPNESRVEQALLNNKELILGNIDLAPYQERLRRNREYLLSDFPTWIELRFTRDCEQLARNLIPS